MRHALFIAFHFPPEASSSGVLRTLKYSRYLGEYGWRVSVIAPEVSAYAVCDPRLQDQVPATTRVVRTPYLNTKRHLSVCGIYPALLALPDVWVGWMPWAIAAGRKLMVEDPVDLIYSTSPHATAHLIAERLAAGSGRPWVADFRDPWIEDPPEPGTPDGRLYRAVNRWLEKRVVTRCDALVTSTLHLRDDFRTRYPGLLEAKSHAILNGYDEADFAGLQPAGAIQDTKLRIVHTGSINADFRDPRPLFAAIKSLIDSRILAATHFELRFIGAADVAQSSWVSDAVEAAGLQSSVVFVPRLPYEQSLRELGSADLLLLLQASDDTVGLVPAKLYEYLRAQKPTLALVQEGAVTEVLAQTGGGWCVDPQDTAALQDALGRVVQSWRSGKLAEHHADLSIVKRFDRRSLTGDLARLFERTCTGDAA